ncbi:MAG: hypothetical protein ACYTAS_09390 [Planctomycetota bacterium]|jgi:hypothetical protein
MAVRVFTNTEPSETPSSRIVSIDPCDTEDTNDAPAPATLLSRSTPDVTTHGSDTPNTAEPSESEDTDVDASLVDSPDLPLPEEATSLGPGATISGQVVRADGTPFQGQDDGWPEMLRVHVTAPGSQRVCAVSDEGRFTCSGLDTGLYEVSLVDLPARHRLLCHGVRVEVVPEVAPEEVVLVLGKEVPVTVQILHEESLLPAPDCSVVAECVRAPGRVGAKTDNQGLCELSLITGQYRLYIPWVPAGHRQELAAKLVSVKVTDAVFTIELLLPPPDAITPMIRGVLVDAEGNPVEGYVTLESVRQEPGAAPASSFAIPEPTHRPPEGLIGYAYNISGELARRFVWQKNASNEEMTIVLEPCASIVGHLVDSARKPVSSARLDLEIPMLDGRWRGDVGALDTAAVDDDGYFQFDRVPVGSKVRIAARRGTFSGQSRQIVLTSGQIADAGQIVMTGPRPGAGLVQGRIADETGAPIADRSIMVRTGRRGQWLSTDAAGYYLLTELPTGRPLTIEVEVKPYGSWSRIATPDDFACDFRLTPQGWSVVGEEAPPLFAARWFNHAPVTLSELRGRVVLLTFRKFEQDADPGLSRLRNVQREYGPQGLTIIAAYDHLSVSSPLAEDIVAEHLAGMFKGLPIAGFLDTEPALVADLMPVERPTAAAAGATHWMYQVHTRPAFFLIDKTGIVQHVTAAELELRQWIRRLLDEEGVSPSP